ncbi:MAG: iron ABC transporter permease [Firmicutes bacterium]|nr:iron ABC transporter permease [Bacillota bacterium]
MLIIGSFSEGIGTVGKFTLEKYKSAYSDPTLMKTLSNTLIFTLGTASFSTILGALLAYLNVRTNMPFKGLFRILPIVPMMIPHVLFTAAWITLLNPTNGMFNVFLQNLFGLAKAPFNIYSLGGMVFLEGMLDLPVTYLVMSPAMHSFDTMLEEASRVSGASNAHTLRKITLPILKPSLLATFTLAIIRSLAAFAVPSMVGMPGRIHVLTTHVYRIISVGWSPDYGKAAAIGLIVLAAAITLVYFYRHLISEGSQYVTVTGKGYRPTIIELGRARYPVFAFSGLFFAFLVIIPLATLVYMSFLPYSMVPSARAFSMMNLRNWKTVLSNLIILRAFKNSAFLAVFGATITILLSIFVAYVIVKIKSKSSAFIESLSFLSFSFPGMIIGVGFMWFLVRTPLYATIWGLLVAYAGTYLPYGVRPLRSAFMQIDEELEESARVFGASFLRALRDIVIPLLAPGVISAWILTACMFIRELSVSVVLSRPGTEVLTVEIMKLANDGLWGQVAALGLIMIALSTSLVIAANLLRVPLSHAES